MYAITLRGFGGPEVMDHLEAEDPVPGPGRVLVRMTAAGVRFREEPRHEPCRLLRRAGEEFRVPHQILGRIAGQL